jgi:protein involved in ribonucleotide reduction
LTKCDLIPDQENIRKFIKKMRKTAQIKQENENRVKQLTREFSSLLDSYGGVDLLPLNITSEESI